MNTTKFLKKLTAAEVGNKGTHEIYIRMPNDFDYESFFDNTHIVNGSVIEVNFEVTVESHIDKKLSPKISNLRFAYFANSNKEKRIPSLGTLFKEFNVQEGDVISLEKVEQDNKARYYLRFLPPESVQFYNGGILLRNANDIQSENQKVISVEKKPLQVIYYGAPGTGKSYTIDKITTEKNSVRTTFHPDSDYASCVGAYKPTMENLPVSAIVGKEVHEAVPQGKHTGKEKKIVYKYVPQAFLKAYVKAWGDLENPYYLIIEEINRGNCAQIFGDLFQLLDRNNMGASSYPILADEDITRFLNEDENGFAGLTEQQKNKISDFVLIKDSGERRDIGEDILKGKHLLLPPNLHIWATMNTSDQSLFPIDSAFKRRWDWEYVPIDYAPEDKKTHEKINWKFEVEGKLYDWGKFIKSVNKIILKETESPDKQMGYFFAKPDKEVEGKKVISEKKFINKVLFYLFGDVLKDYDLSQTPFTYDKEEKGVKIKVAYEFTDFFDKGKNALLNIVKSLQLNPSDLENRKSDENVNDENEDNLISSEKETSNNIYLVNGKTGKVGDSAKEIFKTLGTQLTIDQIKDAFTKFIGFQRNGADAIVEDVPENLKRRFYSDHLKAVDGYFYLSNHWYNADAKKLIDLVNEFDELFPNGMVVLENETSD